MLKCMKIQEMFVKNVRGPINEDYFEKHKSLCTESIPTVPNAIFHTTLNELLATPEKHGSSGCSRSIETQTPTRSNNNPNSEVNFSIHSSPVPYEMSEFELSTSANGVHPLSDKVVQSDSTIIYGVHPLSDEMIQSELSLNKRQTITESYEKIKSFI